MTEKKILIISRQEKIRTKIIEHMCIASPDVYALGAANLETAKAALMDPEHEGPLLLLVTEIELDGYTGFDMVKLVHETYSNARVIFIPFIEQIKDNQDKIAASANTHDIICQPLIMKHLEIAIKTAIKSA